MASYPFADIVSSALAALNAAGVATTPDDRWAPTAGAYGVMMFLYYPDLGPSPEAVAAALPGADVDLGFNMVWLAPDWSLPA